MNGTPESARGGERGGDPRVAAAHRVDGGHRRADLEGGSHGPLGGDILAVQVTDDHHLPARGVRREPLPERGEPLLLPEEAAVAQGREHRPIGRAEEVVQEVGGRRAGGRVVEADVRHPVGTAHVGDQRDGRDAALPGPLHGLRHRRVVGCLEDQAVADPPGRAHGVHRRGQRLGRGTLTRREARPHGGRARGGQRLLDRSRHGVPEAAGRVEHDVDEQGAPRKPHLRLLALQLEHRGLHGAHGAGADPRSSVEHPVHRRHRHAGLLRDVADPVAAADHPPMVTGRTAHGQRHGIHALRSF